MPVIYRTRPIVLTITLLAWAALTVLATPWVDPGHDWTAYRILAASVAITGTTVLVVLACQRSVSEVYEQGMAAGRRAQLRDCNRSGQLLRIRR